MPKLKASDNKAPPDPSDAGAGWVDRYVEERLRRAIPSPVPEEKSAAGRPETIDVAAYMARLRQQSAAGPDTTRFKIAVRGRVPHIPAPPPPKPPPKHRPRLKALMHYDGVEFVRAAYLAVLGREPDAGGLRVYSELLRNGGADRVELLRILRDSPEGRTYGAQVRGLATQLWLRGWGRRLRRIGRKRDRRPPDAAAATADKVSS